MINELRVYYTMPGKLQELNSRFEKHTLKIWERFGITSIGFWTTLIGEDNNTLYYMLAWDSLAEREKKWNSFIKDPEWLTVRENSEKNGPLVSRISSQLLSPTIFSSIK